MIWHFLCAYLNAALSKQTYTQTKYMLHQVGHVRAEKNDSNWENM